MDVPCLLERKPRHVLGASSVKAPLFRPLAIPDPIPMPACKEHWLCREGKLALSLLPAPMQLWKAGRQAGRRSLALHWDRRHLLCYPVFDHGVTSVQKPCATVLKGAGCGNC